MHSMSLTSNLLQAPLKQGLALYDCDPKVLGVGPGTEQVTSITFIPLVTVLTVKHTGLWIPRCHHVFAFENEDITSLPPTFWHFSQIPPRCLRIQPMAL